MSLDTYPWNKRAQKTKLQSLLLSTDKLDTTLQSGITTTLIHITVKPLYQTGFKILLFTLDVGHHSEFSIHKSKKI